MNRSAIPVFSPLTVRIFGWIGCCWLLCCPAWTAPSAGGHKEVGPADLKVRTWQFTVTFTDPVRLPKPQTHRVWMDPQRTRMENNGQVTIYEGGSVYTFDPKRKKGTKIQRPVHLQPERINTPEYWAKLALAHGHKTSTVSLQGAKCDVYEAKEGLTTTRVWIRPKDRLALKAETLWNGKFHTRTEFRDVRANPSLSASLMAPPKNVDFSELGPGRGNH